LQEQYVSNITLEAQIVHAADSIDILLQILELRRNGYPPDLTEDLWYETVKKVKGAPLGSAQQLLKMLTRKRARS
jgi:hypothetical protein